MNDDKFFILKEVAYKVFIRGALNSTEFKNDQCENCSVTEQPYEPTYQN